MKSPRQPSDPEQQKLLTRPERFQKQGLPLILGASAVALAAVLVAQAVTNEQVKAERVQGQTDEYTEDENFEKALKEAAIRTANIDDMANPSLIVIPSNEYVLYDIAPQVAEEEGLLSGENSDIWLDQIHTSSVAISEAGLIQPGSGFVLSYVDVNNDGKDELIVQPAPKGYGQGVE